MSASPPVSVKPAFPRHRPAVQIPSPLESDICRIAAFLIAQHGDVFIRDRQLKHRLAARLKSLLPPQPRPAGRPGREDVNIAECLLKDLQRRYPGKSSRGLWKHIYPVAIVRYNELGNLEKRIERENLRNRLRWRRRDRKRYLLKKGQRISG
jgi:hypothetical protein